MATPSVLLTRGLRVSRPISIRNIALCWTEKLAAGGLLVGLAPLLGAVMLAVRALSGRSPLIAHRRVGLNGEHFWILKVRTMWDPSSRALHAPWIEYLTDTSVPSIKGAPDPRVTSRLAAFCRRYSVDELPQLLHVVTGRMSLVGPRPLTPSELEQYYGADSGEILSIHPGLTGLWQVMGRNRLTYPQRRRLDLFYVRKYCMRLYLRILLRTPAQVFSGRDAW